MKPIAEKICTYGPTALDGPITGARKDDPERDDALHRKGEAGEGEVERAGRAQPRHCEEPRRLPLLPQDRGRVSPSLQGDAQQASGKNHSGCEVLPVALLTR